MMNVFSEIVDTFLSAGKYGNTIGQTSEASCTACGVAADTNDHKFYLHHIFF